MYPVECQRRTEWTNSSPSLWWWKEGPRKWKGLVQPLLGLWAQPELSSPFSSSRALPLTYDRVELRVGESAQLHLLQSGLWGKNRFLHSSIPGEINPWAMVQGPSLGGRSHPFPPCFHLPTTLSHWNRTCVLICLCGWCLREPTPSFIPSLLSYAYWWKYRAK